MTKAKVAAKREVVVPPKQEHFFKGRYYRQGEHYFVDCQSVEQDKEENVTKSEYEQTERNMTNG